MTNLSPVSIRLFLPSFSQVYFTEAQNLILPDIQQLCRNAFISYEKYQTMFRDSCSVVYEGERLIWIVLQGKREIVERF